MGPRLRGDDSRISRAHEPSRLRCSLLTIPYSLLPTHSLPERLERQDRARVLDARNGLHLLVDEVPDIGVGVDVELHQEVEVARGGIDFGGDLGVGDPVGHVVGLAQVAFDLHEEGNHICLLPAFPALRQSSKNPSLWQGVAWVWPIEYDRGGGSNMAAPQVDLRL